MVPTLLPKAELAFDSFDAYGLLAGDFNGTAEKILRALLLFLKEGMELPHLEYRDLDGADSNFPSVNEEYLMAIFHRILVEESQTEIAR